MRLSLALHRGSWTMADQLIVSGGTFLVTLLLARQLPVAEYGVFAVLLGAMLTLQLPGGALLLYPLSVRLQAIGRAAERAELVQATLVLNLLLAAVLGVVLAPVLAASGRADLMLPALLCFVSWQAQEATRRCLFATFRHRAAILGDTVSYAGQALIVVALAHGDALNLSGAYLGMAATSIAAAAIQWVQLKLPLRGSLPLRRVALEAWAFGGGWSLANGILSQLRGLVLTWAVAIEGGIAAAAALQAAANVVNMANPLLISLGNIIPQAAARAAHDGPAEAWRAARSYAWLALPFFAGYAVLVLVLPEAILRLFYGAGSDYAGLATVLRLLVVGALLGYAADIVVSFLHGVVKLRLATWINGIGLAAALALAWPLVGPLGLLGGCLVAIGANLARLVACRGAMTKVVGPPVPSAGPPALAAPHRE
jgi:O-antigen/teichoic acid export membrane protein